MKNNYNDLEDQIGGIGADDSLKGKRLKHAASYGQKEELSEKEQIELDSFLSRSNKKVEEIHNQKEKELMAI